MNQDGDQKMPTTFFLNNMTYSIKKMTLAKLYPKFSHIDTTAYTKLRHFHTIINQVFDMMIIKSAWFDK